MKKNNIYLLVALLILLISIVYGKYNKENFDNNNNIILIISRYNEKLEWLKEEPFNKYPVIIYNKGPNDDFYKPEKLIKIVKVDNIGRCDHTYIYHIINEYDNLYNINVFLPGSANMDNKKHHALALFNKIEESNKAVFLSNKTSLSEWYDFKLDEWKASSPENNIINPENKLKLSEIRPFGKWYEHNFKNIELEYVTYGGMFSVSKEDIIQHPKNYYEKLIKYLENSSNPECGHYFERAWYAVFYPMKNTLIKT
uniref:DUF3431 domain-containing protein n=1 Tax=viral metagenome TaxID=1070528 RepID=A0A6C0JKE2_9ZZZZ